MKCLVFVVVLIGVFVTESQCRRLEEVYKWKELQFAWPSENAKQQAIQNGNYIPKNNLPLGLDLWEDKLFVTVPRWKGGVAASLGYISLSDGQGILHPYPDWDANTLPGSDASKGTTEATEGVDRLHAQKATESDERLKRDDTIISTFRIRVDECDRLWVMDTGLADILGSPKQYAPPALVIFDLKTNQLIRRYTIPKSSIKENSFFANVIVDTCTSTCDNAFAYLPDLGGYIVLVYSFKDNKSWVVKHNYFHFDPLQGNYNVGGVNFQWTDGVFGMAVGKVDKNGDRNVYFHALSSTKEFVVSNRVLQDEERATSTDSYHDFKLLGDRGMNSQATAEYYDDDTEVIFYTQVNKDAIGCWNTNKNFNPDTQGLVDSDSEALIFPNDLKVDRNGTLWVLSDRMPVFIYKTLDDTQFNYRILKGNVKELIQGTPCA